MSGFRSTQAKERAHSEEELASRRSRWMSGLFWYQSTVGAIGRNLQCGSGGGA
jgi:hypothetical protein